MPWSYDEDIYILLNKDNTAITISKKLNRTPNQIRMRRQQLKDTDIDTLEYEMEFILENYKIMEVRDIAKQLKLTKSMVSRRIHAFKREGYIPVE
ncbi:MAG: MarR family winged helix-turn-helix transcriptional regulator [Tissierellaceae bacterium]|nr:MarR family winged helix-turn-helix transcriptional regulator [Tissierellaceae bacterium]